MTPLEIRFEVLEDSVKHVTRITFGILAPLLLVVGVGACESDIGDPCDTKCATGPKAHCLEENKLNGCSTHYCVAYGTEYTPDCLPCYASGTVSEEPNRCLEGVFIRWESLSLGACTRTCDSDADCKRLGYADNFVCRACNAGDNTIKYTDFPTSIQAACDALALQPVGTRGICGPPRDETHGDDKLLVTMTFDPGSSCYVEWDISKFSPQERNAYLHDARKTHPHDTCEGYCTKTCDDVTDCPNSTSWDCVAPYSVGGHPLVGVNVCVRVE